jgi:hypothetical protein
VKAIALGLAAVLGACTTAAQDEVGLIGTQADAVLVAAEKCKAPSDMEQIEGTNGTEPEHYRCRPITPKNP